MSKPILLIWAGHDCHPPLLAYSFTSCSACLVLQFAARPEVDTAASIGLVWARSGSCRSRILSSLVGGGYWLRAGLHYFNG